MLDKKVATIFSTAQESTARHHKCLLNLKEVYKTLDFDSFVSEFMHCLTILFHQHFIDRKTYIERCLDFAAKFCTIIAIEAQENSDSDSEDSEQPTHPLLTYTIQETIKYHNLDCVNQRYWSCRFIALVLKHMGENPLDSDICDSIQESMLKRIHDSKHQIRLQAATALVRLQQPGDKDCPVIRVFMKSVYDSNPSIRKTIIQSICFTSETLPKILERLRDVDHNVRFVAFNKCAVLNPDLLKIYQRQLVIRTGIAETHVVVKRAFLETLLPKWLSHYNDDLIKFYGLLKLDADEADMKHTTFIYKHLTELLCKSHPIQELIDNLSLDNGKLIPLEKLNVETASYWNYLTNYVRQIDKDEDFLDQLIPELRWFCQYISNFVEVKTSKKMDAFESLIYEHILSQLFEMVQQYDFADEVGRKELKPLITKLLSEQKFNSDFVAQLVKLLSQITEIKTLCDEVSVLISDIHEPLITVEPTKETTIIKEFKLAELRVKLNILRQDKEEAVDNAEYATAAVLKEQITTLTKQIEDLKMNADRDMPKERKARDDVETLCRCLDMLIGLLQLPSLTMMYPSLTACKESFVLPLLTNGNAEVLWRAVKVVVQFCLIDKQTLQDHWKQIFKVLTAYRLTQDYEKNLLIVSVTAAADLVCVHGPGIFDSNKNPNGDVSNATVIRRRKLFSTQMSDEIDMPSENSLTFEVVVDTLADVLDEECSDLQFQAGRALLRLMMCGAAKSSSLVSRLLLKWFARHTDVKLQHLLGTSLVEYAQQIDGSEIVLEKAVIPTLICIAEAPPTSPLADIDVDGALRFLAAVTSIKQTQNSLITRHKSLVHSICHRILNKPKHQSVGLLSKMLTYLDLSNETPVDLKELIQQSELLLEDVTDRLALKYITRFLHKLKKPGSQSVDNTAQTIDTTERTATSDNFTRPSVSVRESTESVQNGCLKVQNDNSMTKTVKRRKQRTRKSKENRFSDVTEEQEEVFIETCTSESSAGSQNNVFKVMVSQTSSDSESNENGVVRRSKRKAVHKK